MKTACIRTVATAMAMGLCTGLQASVTEHQPPAPLPEFKTPEQLAKWRADQNQKSQPSASSQEGDVFYTGKPYLAESGSYAFKYREYNPEMGRWTTIDPSGFPDGPNNRMYAAVPTSEIDQNGLNLVAVFSLSAVTGLPINNNSELNNAISASGLFQSVYSDVQTWLHQNVSGNGALTVDMTLLGNQTPNGSSNPSPGHYDFVNDGNLNWLMHGITFSVSGDIMNYSPHSGWTYDATVSYNKDWTFMNHLNDGSNITWYNLLGVGLQINGNIKEFQVSGSFNKTWHE